MALEKPNPGIWIGGAVALAAVVVALSIPGKKPEAAKPVESAQVPPAPPPTKPSAPPPSSPPVAVVQPAPSEPATSPSLPAAVATVPPAAPAVAPTLPAPVPGAPPTQPTAPPEVPISRDAVMTALDNLQFALRDFRTALGGNPVGTNAEITSAILGNNLKQLALPQPEGSKVNAAGELCDPWGTPYFFHQQSGTKMEIRSAGADRKMWTADDIQM